VFLHLRAELNWCRMFNEMIDGFDAAQLAADQRAVLAAAGL
jgi:hypothetical protein